MPINASALCQPESPFKFTIPYSVTTYIVFARVSVTMEPFAKVGRIRDCTSPCLFLKVEERQIKLFPRKKSMNWCAANHVQALISAKMN